MTARQRLRIDQLLRRHAVDVHVEQRHALFDETLGAGQTDAALVGEQFAHGADAAAAEVIDVVQRAFARLQAEQILRRGDEIFLGQNALVEIDFDAELLVDLVTADAAEIVLLRIEEQALEKRAGVRGGRRIARTQAAVDILQRLFLVVRRILLQRLDDGVVVAWCRSTLTSCDAELRIWRTVALVSGSKARATRCTSPSRTSSISTLFASLLFVELLAQLQLLDVVEKLDDSSSEP